MQQNSFLSLFIYPNLTEPVFFLLSEGFLGKPLAKNLPPAPNANIEFPCTPLAPVRGPLESRIPK